MLEVKEVRECIKRFKPEDFKPYQIIYGKDVKVEYDNFSDWENKDFIKTQNYPLFLTRTVEAILKGNEYFIDIEHYNGSWTWRVFEGEFIDEDSFLIMGENKNIDESKEEAIKYILDQK